MDSKLLEKDYSKYSRNHSNKTTKNEEKCSYGKFLLLG